MLRHDHLRWLSLGGALFFASFGCVESPSSDAPFVGPTPVAGGSSGGVAGASSASGASGQATAGVGDATSAGGSAGGDLAGGAGAGGKGGVSEGGASGGGAAGSAGSAGAAPKPMCPEPCGPLAPVCDETSLTCKPIEVIAIYTLDNPDLAHRSYDEEAIPWFTKMAPQHGFTFESGTDWGRLTSVTPHRGRVLFFMDDKPKDPVQQAAFKQYMDGGGAWLGCHFAAYNPMPSVWEWYFTEFLGSGGYNGNTWRPTSAQLKVEAPEHPVLSGLGTGFKAQPNEWYRFLVDLRTLSNIQILLSIDPVSFPLGTGPNPKEIWHEGYYPVVWTNKNYKMLYVNMGHNDMDYGGTNKALSSTFGSEQQNQLILQAIQWLGAAE